MLPIGPAILFNPSNPAQLNTTNLSMVDASVNNCITAGLTVTLNLHPTSNDTDSLLSHDAGFVNKLAAYWKSVATYFKKYPADKLYFEVYNEPHAAAARITSQGYGWWQPVQGKLIAAIREATAEHYIIAGGEGWNSIDGLLIGQLLSMSRVWLFVFFILTIVYSITYGFHLKNYINIYFLCFLYGDIAFSLSNLFIKRLDETKLKIEKEVEKGMNKNDLALLYYKTGFESFDKNNFKDAIENFTNSIDILKELPKNEENDKLLRELFYNRGNSKDELKDYSGAIDDYNLAIEYGGVNKDESEFLNRALAKFELGFYEDAINDYNQVIEINPKNAKAYFGRGNAKYKNNSKDGACDDWKESEKLGFEYASKMIENYCKK